MFCAPASGQAEERYYLSEYSATERAAGLHLPALAFAHESRSERGSAGYWTSFTSPGCCWGWASGCLGQRLGSSGCSSSGNTARRGPPSSGQQHQRAAPRLPLMPAGGAGVLQLVTHHRRGADGTSSGGLYDVAADVSAASALGVAGCAGRAS